MFRSRIISTAARAALLGLVLFSSSASHAAGACGDGVLDGNEECDGGPGGLYLDGDPANASCSNGSRCYFGFTCCKFNCQYVGTPGAPCQDGDNCTGPDTCDQVGVCHGGPNAADNTPCDDGLFCTGVESCQNGECVSSTGDPCPGTACNQCQEDTDTCLNLAGAPCSSGDTCVTGGTCDGAGTCVGGVFNNEPCDDGLFCNGTDSCDGGACHIHTGDPCGGPDGDSNCSESCDEESDTCAALDPDGAPCDDGLFCNGAGDTCEVGACLGTGVAGCDDANSCTTDFCDEGTDGCMYTSLGDGTVCSDGDPCSLDDVCAAGFCVGAPPLLDDFCPWTLLLREQARKDQIKTYFQVGVEGDVCGGSIRFYGQTSISSDLVADEALGDEQLSLAEDVVVGEDIVSAGGGAKSNPSISFLPYTDASLSELAPGLTLAKADATGFYDLSGTHPLVAKCHAARTSYAAYTAALDALVSTATVPRISLKPGQTTTIAATNVGGLNVIDVDGTIKAGDNSVVVLDGGGSPGTVVVLRIAGRLKMLVLSTLSLENGLTPDHVLVYVKGKKCLLNTLSIGGGTLLCSPGRVVAKQSVAWVGAVFGDGKRLFAGQRATFSYVPFQGF